MKKKWILSVVLLMTVVLFITGCGNKEEASTSSKEKVLKISFNPGPYSDQFKNGVAPYLEKKGYKIEYTDFSDGIQPNVAVAQGEIDANVFQHSLYLQSINEKEKIDLVGIVQVPTPPMGLYSEKHKSLEEVKKGATITVPNEPVNLLRALTLLQDVGWITLKDNIEPLKASVNDITSNPHQLEFVIVDPAQGPPTLPDVDFAAIQGNFAISNNMKLTSALQLEKMTDPFTNIVAVDSKNKDKQFAKDIIAGYHSKEFKEYITSHEQYDGYKLPNYFTN